MRLFAAASVTVIAFSLILISSTLTGNIMSTTSLVRFAAAKSGGHHHHVRICAFCANKITEDSSICDNCKKKYSIRSYDLSKEGCGCDD